MNKIFILTGKIKSGKTTWLDKWCAKEKSVAGILQPVINDKRHIKSISTGEIRQLETDKNHTDSIQIGNYFLNKSILEWAKISLLADAAMKTEWLVVDEFGKLELKNIGLEPVITFLINDLELREKTKLILVVRDYLLADFLNKFNLTAEDFEILEMKL